MKGISQALKSADEVKAVAAELQRNARSNLFYCLWVFMYESGLRISDVLKLKYEDVEGQSHLKVKQEKTGNVVRPKVTASMLSVVAQRKAEQAKMPVATDYIFSAATLRSKGQPVTRNTVFAEFGKMGRRAGFSNVGCHTPRKSRGRVMFDAGVAIETIAHFLGQTDPRSGRAGRFNRGVFFRMVINMKGLIVLTLALLPALAHAAITLTLTDEQETDNAKICIYSNANYTETVTIRPSQQCRYTMTFEEE